MCRKLLLLIAVLGLVGTAWADDLNPPEWRGDEGSAVFHWTYDATPPYDPTPEDSFPRLDPPDFYEYWAHPGKEPPGNFFDRAADPESEWIYEDPPESGNWVPGWPGLPVSHYTDNSAMQLWGEYEWVPEYKGRTGVLAPFEMGSWDIYNFWSDPPQPYKDFQIQMTWRPMEITEGWYECPEYLWNAFDWPEPESTWYDEELEENMAGGTLNLGETYYDDQGGEVYVGDIYNAEVVGFTWELEYMPADDYEGEWGEGYDWLEEVEPFEIIDLAGDWELWKFAFTVEPNPYVEFLGLFPIGTPIGDPYELWGSWLEGPTATWPEGWPDIYETWIDEETGEEWGGVWAEATPEEWDPLWGDPVEEWMEQERGPSAIALDQIVIDTICIPEPATIALLGLGGLFLIRRRKQR